MPPVRFMICWNTLFTLFNHPKCVYKIEDISCIIHSKTSLYPRSKKLKNESLHNFTYKLCICTCISLIIQSNNLWLVTHPKSSKMTKTRPKDPDKSVGWRIIQLTISIQRSPHTEIFQFAQGRTLHASQTFEMECSLACLLIPHTKTNLTEVFFYTNVDKTMIKYTSNMSMSRFQHTWNIVKLDQIGSSPQTFFKNTSWIRSNWNLYCYPRYMAFSMVRNVSNNRGD